MKRYILILGILSVLILISCQNNQPTPPLVGGDKDEHGCIGSAGYQWCESSNKCIRYWEENCSCAGIAGFKCPKDTGCEVRSDIPDALGVCKGLI